MRHRKYSALRKIFMLLHRIHIQPYWLLVPITLSLLAASFEGVGMGLLVPILQGFFQKSFAFVWNVPVFNTLLSRLPASVTGDDRMLFGILLSGFIIMFITKNGIRFLSVCAVTFFSERTLHHLRKTLFARYLSFGKQFFDSTAIGHHTTLLQEFTRLSLYPILTIDRVINAVFSLAVYFVVMCFISLRLTMLALPLFVFLHFIIRFMIVRIKSTSHILVERGAELGTKSVETLSVIPLVKAHATERLEQQRFAALSDKKARLDYRVNILQSVILPLQEIITVIIAAVIFVGTLAVFGREQIASAPAVLVFFYAVMNGSQKLGAVSGYRGILAAANGPLDYVLEIFDDTDKHFVRGGSRECPPLGTALEIRHLNFSYLDRTILHDISCTFPRGSMTAIVGPTGAGKTTITNLLMRYYDCPGGTMLYDGVDIRDFVLDSYLSRIAIVSQETFLLNDSLKNNILYGQDHASDDALQSAVDRARLRQFIDQLPRGLDTPIGDRGVKLSGGEKQRVSIARALLRKADILILDEATSSLDSSTERLIQEAIEEAIIGRTSIVIAHRLSTIRHADNIIVLQNGRVAEEGGLEQLLAKQGIFHGLWTEQKF